MARRSAPRSGGPSSRRGLPRGSERQKRSVSSRRGALTRGRRASAPAWWEELLDELEPGAEDDFLFPIISRLPLPDRKRAQHKHFPDAPNRAGLRKSSTRLNNQYCCPILSRITRQIVTHTGSLMRTLGSCWRLTGRAADGSRQARAHGRLERRLKRMARCGAEWGQVRAGQR